MDELSIANRIYVFNKLKGVTGAYDEWIAGGNTGTWSDFFYAMAIGATFAINEQGELEVTINGDS